MLGIAAGATSAVGIFGLGKDGAHITATPPLVAALAFLGLAIVAALYMLRAKPFDVVDLSTFTMPATLGEDNRAPLALLIAGRYRDARRRLSRELSSEPNVLAVAYGSIALAAVLAALNALSQPTTASSKGQPAAADAHRQTAAVPVARCSGTSAPRPISTPCGCPQPMGKSPGSRGCHGY